MRDDVAVTFMIVLTRVSKIYGTKTVVAPTDLMAETGAVTALIGPSGCGKSTLLRMIVGLTAPSSGSIAIDDDQVVPETLMRIRRRIGYVIQDGGLFPHLTARENVTLMARHLGRPDASSCVPELAELTRFPQDALDRYPLELSGGQRQRVALMRALALKPSTLLLDEPLGALDPLVRSSLQSDLKQIFASTKVTVLLVTHDMGEAAYLADKIVLIRDGRIVQQGSLKQFQFEPAEPYVSEFLNAQRSVVAI